MSNNETGHNKKKIMDQFEEALIAMNITSSRFKEAFVFFYKGIESKDKEDMELAFLSYFSSEPHLIAMAIMQIKDPSREDLFSICRSADGHVLDFTPLEHLIYRAINPSLFTVDYNTTTLSLYKLLGFPFPSLRENRNDVDARILLYVRIFGQAHIDKSNKVVREKTLPFDRLALPFTQHDFESDCTNLSLDVAAFTSLLETFSKRAKMDNITDHSDVPLHLLIFALFTGFKNAVIDPYGCALQRGVFVAQGNLDNLTYFLMEESIGYTKAFDMKESGEQSLKMLHLKLEVFHFITGHPYIDEVGDYYSLLLGLLKKHFGEEALSDESQKMTKALNSLKRQ